MTTNNVVPPTTPPAGTEQGKNLPASPAPPTFSLTQVELEAKIAEGVARAAEAHKSVLEDLNARLERAQSLTDDEKRVDTLKHAYAIGYGMPEEVAEAAAGLVDPAKREKFVATWKKGGPVANAEALASANVKIKGSAADEKMEEMGGGAGRGLSPAATKENIDALWLAAEAVDPVSNPYTAQYRKFLSSGSI